MLKSTITIHNTASQLNGLLHCVFLCLTLPFRDGVRRQYRCLELGIDRKILSTLSSLWDLRHVWDEDVSEWRFLGGQNGSGQGTHHSLPLAWDGANSNPRPPRSLNSWLWIAACCSAGRRSLHCGRTLHRSLICQSAHTHMMLNACRETSMSSVLMLVSQLHLSLSTYLWPQSRCCACGDHI